MAAGGEAAAALSSKNQLVVTCLCKWLEIDPNQFSADISSCDIKSLCERILKSSERTAKLKNYDEVMKWVAFCEGLLTDSKSSLEELKGLNEELVTKAVLLGGGLAVSEVDVVVFSLLHSNVKGLSKLELAEVPHVARWIDWVQNQKNLEGSVEKIMVEKIEFNPPAWQIPKPTVKADKESITTSTPQQTEKATLSKLDTESKKTDAVEKTKAPAAKDDKKVAQEKKKAPEKEPAENDKDLSVSLLNLQVGLIRKAWKHPSADSLLVEEIDVGDKVRQVVSGLAKFCSPDDLTNRPVVLITNVKPGKLRDVMSEGLVLCASNADHSVVEPLLAPEGAKIGERISVAGHEGEPEAVLNPKKKQLDKITPHLFTDDKGVATFKGIPFMTSGGPCTSSIPKATIK